jgi:hypothetical protein
MSVKYTDAFGEAIDEGDYILSAATTGYLLKIGTAVFRPNSLGIRVKHCSDYKRANQKTQQVGAWVVLLQKTDGRIPDRIAASGVLYPPELNDDELPGMWSTSDLIGGSRD